MRDKVKIDIKNCSQCTSLASFNIFQVIKKCSDSFNTLINEALLIRRHNPKLNEQLFTKGTSFTLKIFAEWCF